MRRPYLVCYDIREARRLRKVHKTMKGFGEPWQYSVFFCVLTDLDRVRMESKLARVMDLSEDQALIVEMGVDEDRARDSTVVLGEPLEHAMSGVVVI